MRVIIVRTTSQPVEKQPVGKAMTADSLKSSNVRVQPFAKRQRSKSAATRGWAASMLLLVCPDPQGLKFLKAHGLCERQF
jgi:hypothetical protein